MGDVKRTPMAARSAPMRRTAAKRTAPRYTGPDRQARFLVYEREGLRCASCGTYLGGETCWRSIQHRKARGVGGDNRLENLILLCGSATSPGCHRRAEDRDRELHARGMWLRSDEDPALVPVMLFEPSGSGMTVWLSGDGFYRTEPPEAATS